LPIRYLQGLAYLALHEFSWLAYLPVANEISVLITHTHKIWAFIVANLLKSCWPDHLIIDPDQQAYHGTACWILARCAGVIAWSKLCRAGDSFIVSGTGAGAGAGLITPSFSPINNAVWSQFLVSVIPTTPANLLNAGDFSNFAAVWEETVPVLQLL
jgi:hypothetical protein